MKFVICLTTLFVTLVAANAHARWFHEVPVTIRLNYSNFDVTNHPVGEISGVLRVASDNRFPHFVVHGARFDLDAAAANIDSNKNVTSVFVSAPSAATAGILKKVVPARDPYATEVRTLIERYGRADVLDWRAHGDELFQFHDDVSEESLHMEVEFGKTGTIR